MVRKVLVTGCHGYIGAVLVPMLQERDFQVVGLDIDLYRDADCGSFGCAIPHLPVDLRDITAEHLAGFSAIVHLAALSNDPLGNLDPRLTHDINHAASVNLASSARAAGVERFLLSSSCSMYGAAGDDLLTEDAEFHPITAYGETKVRADREISALANEHFSPTLLRNATAYGFSPRLRLDLVVNDFAAAAYLDKRILIKSDGTPWRPLVHVEDIARAFIAVLESPKELIHDEAFNVGITDENYRVSEVADIVRAAVTECAIEYDPNGGPDKRCYRVNCNKIRDRLPLYRPNWNVRRGVEQLLSAYAEHNLSAADVAARKYIRLAGIDRRRTEGHIDANLRLVGQAQPPAIGSSN